MSDNKEAFNSQLNALLEEEKTIIKKMNTAMRGGANSVILQQMQFMLEECRAKQFELRIVEKEKNQDDDNFNDFLSIG